MYKIALIFENREFEHDIYELIRAFYAGCEITELYTSNFQEHQTDAAENDSAVEETQNLSAYDILFTIRKEQAHPEDTACFIIEYKGTDGEGEISIPVTEGQDELTSDALISCMNEVHAIRKANKDRIKYALYKELEKMTGRSLPWGNLTGIRPVKLAMGMIEAGMKNTEAAQTMREKYLVSAKKTALAVTIANRERDILSRFDYKNGYSLYIGIPFCPSICLYCSFSSYPLKQWKTKVDAYLDALCKEIRAVAQMMKGKKLDTIYIGGGTPTTLEADQLERLLAEISSCFDVHRLEEFTIEAGRPDSITKEKLEAISHYPVTRISVNPQTMNQQTLDLIGRKHTVEEVESIYNLARELGFDNINMDLIVGLPGENIDMVRHTLEEMKRLKPDSLTVHSLAVKRAARLNIFREKYQEMSFENNQEIIDLTMQAAYEMGMGPYYLYRQKNMKGNFENVGYATVDKAGIYNILIMEEKQSIIALGSGGASKILVRNGMENQIERIENVKDVKNYIERIDEMIERKKKGIEKWL
ncbi:MAG: coproporphyrinogen dehydrogenase HemZ [Eubacteriales bacterium]|nr:coproporphyrinogen dehydrogenase HemZ [Eubacteriales bacterium]